MLWSIHSRDFQHWSYTKIKCGQGQETWSCQEEWHLIMSIHTSVISTGTWYSKQLQMQLDWIIPWKMNWCEFICVGKQNPSEVKENSTEAVMQKEQTVPTYEKAQKHALGHFPKRRGKLSKKKAAKQNQALSSLCRMVQREDFQWLVLPLGWWDSGCPRLNKWSPFREE